MQQERLFASQTCLVNSRFDMIPDVTDCPVLPCSLSVSHPNCITTYKLSVVRVLTEGEEHSLSRPSSVALESELHSGESSLVGAMSDPLSPEDALKAAAAAMETAAAGGTQQPPPAAAAAKPAAPSKPVSRSNSGARALHSGDSGVVEVLPTGSGSGGAAAGSGGERPSGKPPRPAAADSAATTSSESRRTPSGRRLQSLLSGAAAVEVVSTNEVRFEGRMWLVLVSVGGGVKGQAWHGGECDCMMGAQLGFAGMVL